jgi:hypothetical protein
LHSLSAWRRSALTLKAWAVRAEATNTKSKRIRPGQKSPRLTTKPTTLRSKACPTNPNLTRGRGHAELIRPSRRFLPPWSNAAIADASRGGNRVTALSSKNAEAQMADSLEWRQRLESSHKQLLEAMTELITNKNYSETERILYVVDKLMIDLIEDMGGIVVRSGLWT